MARPAIDSLYGEANDDSLSGGTGNDSLYGGTGNDSLSRRIRYGYLCLQLRPGLNQYGYYF